jgi:hypothetical protein
MRSPCLEQQVLQDEHITDPPASLKTTTCQGSIPPWINAWTFRLGWNLRAELSDCKFHWGNWDELSPMLRNLQVLVSQGVESGSIDVLMYYASTRSLQHANNSWKMTEWKPGVIPTGKSRWSNRQRQYNSKAQPKLPCSRDVLIVSA